MSSKYDKLDKSEHSRIIIEKCDLSAWEHVYTEKCNNPASDENVCVH